jgi:YVTN family beta-propeller protein
MKTGQARVLLAEAGVALLAAALISGCGNNYRPVVTPVNPSGPAPQVTAYVVAVSSTGSTIPGTPGIATVIDYSGDTIMAEAPLGPGNVGYSPISFTLDAVGSTGYTINSDGTITNIPVSIDLQQKLETYTTLSPTALPVNMQSPSGMLWIADLYNNAFDLYASSPATFQRSIPVSTGGQAVIMPVTMAGAPSSSGQREYAISQNITDPTSMFCNTSPRDAAANGEATPIEIASDTVDTPIPLGKCPVYAVQSRDLQRLYVLNRGDDTITVINTQTDSLDDQCPTGCLNTQNGQTYYTHPVLPLSTTAVTATHVTPLNGTIGMTATAGPVYAEFNQATAQLVVADYDGGTISVIDVSLDEYGNDSATFGTTYTIPVGNDPASVTVLADGSKAYSANQADSTVTVVNLSSYTVEKTLTVVGHPRTVLSIQNSEYSKVYAASPDSNAITIIASTPTQIDVPDTTVPVEGIGVVDIRSTNQNGVSGSNYDYVSRVPGYGEPCTSPGVPVPTGSQTLLQACQAIP